MALNLHVECRKRLHAAIRDVLPQLTLEYGSLLSPDSIAALALLDAILPKDSGKLGLVGHLSDRPVMHFVIERISTDLRDVEPWTVPRSMPLSEAPGYSDASVAAERIVSAFETLPWQYTVFFMTAMPTEYQLVFGSQPVSLGEGLRLMVPDSGHARHFPIENVFHGSDKMIGLTQGRYPPSAWNGNRFYLEASLSGFIGRYTSDHALSHFLARVKAFYGFLLVFGIASREYGFSAPGNRHPVLRFGPAADPADVNWLSSSDVSQFASMRVSNVSDTSGERQRALRTLLPIPFAKANDSIRHALRWYFDAATGPNELLAFVQAMIVLEILFGDKALADAVGVVKLIGNRCAYLVGSTRDERERIIADLGKLYATRSDIVHRGKEDLSSEEKDDFGRLLELCRRSIGQELFVAYRGTSRGA